ncbi:DNA gyrase subunit B [Alphaproteobacteria bacterium endosymbiont of Tiliacea citrago]|uniref:DNA gyrase subunit B n=1 Tax=Alphaproteobacteria bacterium endosymbiont of Tiliacea citrago TaxID=3077944 RepID=UPI00313CD44E
MSYNSSSIKVLKGLEACRTRPGMYIGNLEHGVFQMLKEVLDNCIDEHLANHCSQITIVFYKDGFASVEDNGRGIPVDIHKEEGVSAAIVIMTQLHAGGKFDQDSYKVSGGLHGVGVSVVNALSNRLDLSVFKDGYEYKAAFEKGDLVEDLVKVGPTKKQGTFIKFKPDHTILENNIFNLSETEKRVKELSYLNPGLKIKLIDERCDYSQIFHEPNGLEAFVESLVKKEKINDYIKFEYKEENVQVFGGFLWTKSYSEDIRCFTNNIPQTDGGTHLIGFKTALTRCVNNYISKEPNLVKKLKNLQISGDDIREGVVCVLSIYVSDPQFSSQTKEKLVSSNVRSIVEKSVTNSLDAWLEENPNKAKEIVEKVSTACLAREAARKSKEVFRSKNGLENNLSIASKVSGCTLKDPTKCELFLVEGDSAGGSARQARDRMYQAVLGLRGKILNVEKAGFHKMLNDDSIRSLIAVMGTNIGDYFDVTKIKYNKIIIMTDADVDGSHILTLLVTFFFRYMRPVIENGYLYVAKPPLYGIRQGSDITYLVNDEALTEFFFNRNLDKIKFFDQETLIDAEIVKKFLTDLTTVGKDLKSRSVLFQAFLICKFNSKDDFNSELLLEQVEKIKPGKWLVKNSSFVYEINGLTYNFDLNLDLIPRSYWNLIKNWSDFWGSDIKMQYGSSEAKIFNNPFDMYDLFNKQSSSDLVIERYKGLGEMNPEDLKRTAMVNYSQVYYNNEQEADELINKLMGDDVLPRKEFIDQLENIETDDD